MHNYPLNYYTLIWLSLKLTGKFCSLIKTCIITGAGIIQILTQLSSFMFDLNSISPHVTYMKHPGVVIRWQSCDWNRTWLLHGMISPVYNEKERTNFKNLFFIFHFYCFCEYTLKVFFVNSLHNVIYINDAWHSNYTVEESIQLKCKQACSLAFCKLSWHDVIKSLSLHNL